MTAPAPVILIVGGDPRDVETTASALDRRFGSDYRVLTAGSAADGLAELAGLARGGAQVALVAADLHYQTATGSSSLNGPQVCTLVSRGFCCSIWMSSTPEFRFASFPRCSAPAHSAGSTAGW